MRPLVLVAAVETSPGPTGAVTPPAHGPQPAGGMIAPASMNTWASPSFIMRAAIVTVPGTTNIRTPEATERPFMISAAAAKSSYWLDPHAPMDPEQVRSDAACALSLGFTDKLPIHPARIGPAAEELRPSTDEIAWAARVLAVGRAGEALMMNGARVDASVRLRARQSERQAQAGRAGFRHQAGTGAGRFQRAGPVRWMDRPAVSTATVTGMSSTTNSWIASMPSSAKASTRAERIAFATR